MPNHVQNIVTITGSKERLSEFADFVRDEDRSFSFDKIIPMPEFCTLSTAATWRTPRSLRLSESFGLVHR